MSADQDIPASGDDLPDLIGSSEEEQERIEKSKAASKVTPGAQKALPPPSKRAADVGESDDSGDENGPADASQAKKKKKKKKKKSKKKAADSNGDADADAEDGDEEIGEVSTDPVSKDRTEQSVKRPAPSRADTAAQAAEREFRSKWQPVLDIIAELTKRMKVSKGTSKSNGNGSDLWFSWAAQKFNYDVIVENTEEERRHQELTADVLASMRGDVTALDEADMYIEEPALQAGAGATAGNAGAVGQGSVAASAEEADEMPDVDRSKLLPVDLSIAVKKWLEKADEQYRCMFERRITQLAAGQRSYALSKRLKHCVVPIYETKLDAGQRILWSQILRRRSEDNSQTVTLMVWFVAKHDHVPHLLRLIEHSCGRTIKQIEGRGSTIVDSAKLNEVTARYISAAIPDVCALPVLNIPDEAVLLDPQGNIPLKLYPVPDLGQLSRPNWRAPLRLNRLEQSVRSQAGTVLLLGRSGTGKTLCLMDRMQHDCAHLQRLWQQELRAALGAPTQPAKPSQLFVARSEQLCLLVQRYQQQSAMDNPGEDVQSSFMRMRRFLAEMERRILLRQQKLSSAAGVEAAGTGLFHQTHREADFVDFSRFNKEIFPAICDNLNSLRTKVVTTAATASSGAGATAAAKAAAHALLDPLVVWTQIRSFLKGSIEAVFAGGELPVMVYLDHDEFGKDRCRLSPEQRKQAYELFVRYQRFIQEKGWWDDMDRIRHVLNLALRQPAAVTNSSGAVVDPTTLLRDGCWEVHFSKVYVDEIQDYTQAEIALFLLAVGFRTDSLFLAGDPAQSVVEGVDFRFEEVRSLVYKLTSGRESVQRPIKLLTNYRSHDGVLACAAAIIDKLLLMFPGSANVLSKDEGLFTGPRPNYCYAKDPVEVLKLLGAGVAVLAPDNSHWVKRHHNDSNELAAAAAALSLGEGEGVVERAGPGAAAAGSSEAPGDLVGLGNIVMGIRAAKGLEFSDVLVLDFFAGVSEEDSKAWKVLFAENAEVQVRDQQFTYPQLEPQLKMLYTAITRSMNRLLFLETAHTAAGDAFFRWLERQGLADRFDLTAAKQQGEARYITSDEWKVRGIEFALQADTLSGSGGALDRVDEMLRNAARCFTHAGDAQLKNVVQVQRRLLQLVADYRAHQPATSALLQVTPAVMQALQDGLQSGLVEEVKDACVALLEAQSGNELSVALFRSEVCDKLADLT